MNTETILLFIIIALLGFYIISQQRQQPARTESTIVYEQPYYGNWGWNWGRGRGGWGGRGGRGGGHRHR